MNDVSNEQEQILQDYLASLLQDSDIEPVTVDQELAETSADEDVAIAEGPWVVSDRDESAPVAAPLEVAISVDDMDVELGRIEDSELEQVYLSDSEAPELCEQDSYDQTYDSEDIEIVIELPEEESEFDDALGLGEEAETEGDVEPEAGGEVPFVQSEQIAAVVTDEIAYPLETKQEVTQDSDFACIAESDVEIEPEVESVSDIAPPLAVVAENEPVTEPLPETVEASAEVESTVQYESLKCMLVHMYGVKLAIPIKYIKGARYINTVNMELDTSEDWILGSFQNEGQQIYVVDSAMCMIPERYEPENANYDQILLLQDPGWALTCDSMIGAQVIEADEVTWNDKPGSRSWLLGTCMKHRCAVVNIPAMLQQFKVNLG